jgi:hypothetical protein
MIQIRCSVRDRATGLFSRPFYVASAAQAIRSFIDEVNRADPENLFHKHPDDYSLYELVHWDDQTGACNDHADPVLLMTAANAKV